LNPNLGAVEVCDLEVNTSQSLKQSNFLLDQEICTLTLEKLVGLLLNNYNNVTWFDSGVFVGLAMEDILLVVRCTFVDFSFDDLLLFNNFFAIAVLAFVLFIDDFTLSVTIIARSR
jgi:hypothetical protein